MSLTLPRGSTMAQCRVVKRARDNDNNIIGRSNKNPVLDTREYVVEFKDGEGATLEANTIAKSM